MIVCSCNVISDADLEQALIEILNQPTPPLPTPGVVWRHLSARMRCCGCAPLAVDTIYSKMKKLEAESRICPHAGSTMRGELLRRAARSGCASMRRVGQVYAPAANDDDFLLAAE